MAAAAQAAADLQGLRDCLIVCGLNTARLYAVANRIQEEPAFAWWVKSVLRRRNRIISKVKKKYWRTTHKHGVRVPKTWEEALELDRQNGNNLSGFFGGYTI